MVATCAEIEQRLIVGNKTCLGSPVDTTLRVSGSRWCKVKLRAPPGHKEIDVQVDGGHQCAAALRGRGVHPRR